MKQFMALIQNNYDEDDCLDWDEMDNDGCEEFEIYNWEITDTDTLDNLDDVDHTIN